jgi:large subunit ribosomal protein L30
MSSDKTAAKKRGKEMGRGRLLVTLTKSPTGYPERQKRTVRALGLRRLDQTVEHTDTPAVRGMIERVGHLVHVETSEAR